MSNTKLRALNALLRCYSLPIHLEQLEAVQEKFVFDKNDRGVSVLNQVFYRVACKRVAEAGRPDDIVTYLTHARDVWLPRTLNPLKDEEQYVLEILDSLSTGLSLLCYLYSFERNQALDTKILTASAYLDSLNATYFEPLTQTLTAGQSSLEEQKQS